MGWTDGLNLFNAYGSQGQTLMKLNMACLIFNKSNLGKYDESSLIHSCLHWLQI
jgi:hypothetical protein